MEDEKDKKEYTIQKARPKKNKEKINENIKNNPMYSIFGDKLLFINQNKNIL